MARFELCGWGNSGPVKSMPCIWSPSDPQTLIARFGADVPLPDLRVEIAQCERRGKMHDVCGVHYLGLTGS